MPETFRNVNSVPIRVKGMTDPPLFVTLRVNETPVRYAMPEIDDFLVEYSMWNIPRIIKGLSSPRESREFKLARMAISRLLGPTSISIAFCTLVLVGLVTMVTGTTIQQERTLEVQVVEPEIVKPDDLPEPPPPEIEPEPTVYTDLPNPINLAPIEAPVEAPVVNPQAVEMAAPVPILTKSPLIIKNLYGARMNEATRQGQLRAFRGTRQGEDAVLRALRWLKKKQDPDGSWKTASDVDHVAMTGLAILTFLAHGETPQQSQEFGETVKKAIQYLIAVQNKSADGRFSANSYTHAICTYAMAEAYALTKILEVRDSMEKGIDFLIQGQQDEGGFDYVYRKGDRFDVSVAGWNIQALKAAQMAGSQHPELQNAIDKAIRFLKTQAYAQNGSGFVYSGKPGQPSPSGGRWTMTGVGVLCLQLLGHGKSPEARQGLVVLEPLTCKWPKDEKGKPSVYGWYYVTQARFQAGGSLWDSWNATFNKEYVDAQIKEDDGTGYWPVGDHGGAVYTTTLAALALTVYYRYLPTYKQVEEVTPVLSSSPDDIVIQVN